MAYANVIRALIVALPSVLLPISGANADTQREALLEAARLFEQNGDRENARLLREQAESLRSLDSGGNTHLRPVPQPPPPTGRDLSGRGSRVTPPGSNRGGSGSNRTGPAL
jgi:hypothetical protein